MDLNMERNNFVTFPCVRSLLMLFTIVYWISGLSLSLMGIWLNTDFLIYLKVSTLFSSYAPYVLIAIGALIMFITTLACSCIVKIQSTVLVIYGSFLIGMVFTHISLSVYVYSYNDAVISGLSSGIEESIVHYNNSNSIKDAPLIDTIQRNLYCCGDDGYQDWLKARQNISESCCWNREKLYMGASMCNISNPADLFQVGCTYKLKNLIETNLSGVGMAIWAIGLIPLFGTFFACILAFMGDKIAYERLA